MNTATLLARSAPGRLAALALLGGCGSASEEDGRKGSASGGSDGVRQSHARVEVGAFEGDVASILYEVVCDEGTEISRVVPLETVVSLGHVTGGEYAFADFTTAAAGPA